MFCQADSILRSYEHDCEFQVERYHTWTSWTDLITQSMEQTMTIRTLSRELLHRMGEFLEIGIQNAMQASELLTTQWPDSGEWEEQGIFTPTELKQSGKDIRSWWKQQIELATRPLLESRNNHPNVSVSRGDIQNESHTLPSRPFILNPSQKQKNRRRSPYNLGGTGYSNMGVSASSPAPPPPSNTTKRPKYRPWGDVMIDAQTGQWIPKLVYPAVAPEMPAHIREILNRRRQQEITSTVEP